MPKGLTPQGSRYMDIILEECEDEINALYKAIAKEERRLAMRKAIEEEEEYAALYEEEKERMKKEREEEK
jgi:hypothetical protein